MEGNNSIRFLQIQIANMANIDNLFELLNTTKEEQFVQIKNVLADIVHTTRNPLSGVTAAMILLKKEVNLDQSTRELLDDVEKYIQQINESMNAYFKISQIGTVSFDEYDRINFKEELSNRCKLVVLSQGKKVNLRENIDEIWIDRNRAQIILLAVTCILENAIAFSPDNGLISIDVGCDDGELHIFIQNNGPVIEEAVINRIFDQGFSTRNSSGRGLSIAKKSVEEKLHGIILCENVGTDSGVKFSIVLEGVENENIK